MKKCIRLLAALILVLLFATGCANSAAPESSPSPAANAMPDVTAAPENQAQVFTLAGKAAAIHVGGKKVSGSGYYAGKGEENLVVPFSEVCRGLGWAITEPDAAGPIEIHMSKPDQEDIVISFTKPEEDFSVDVGTVVIKKGDQEIKINEMDAMPYIEGRLYANEGFISEAIEEIAIKYDGETLISVEPSA